MIQRTQTIYLALALAAQILQLIFPWVYYISSEREESLKPLDMGNEITNVAPLTLVLIISMAMILITIFQYRNRIRQMRLVRMSTVIVLLGFFLFGTIHYMWISTLSETGEFDLKYSLPVFLPFVSAILLWLANRNIRKDENLVRSADRIR